MAYPFAVGRPGGFSSGLRSFFGRRQRPSGRRAGYGSKLIFEALEPRVLLNADLLAVDLTAAAPDRQDHDLLVRMVEETQTIEQQSVTVQRIEVMDRNDSDAVLAFGDLSQISQLSITAGAGDDTLTIDLNSFVGFSVPDISFDGGDGGATTRSPSGLPPTHCGRSPVAAPGPRTPA